MGCICSKKVQASSLISGAIAAATSSGAQGVGAADVAFKPTEREAPFGHVKVYPGARMHAGAGDDHLLQMLLARRGFHA